MIGSNSRRGSEKRASNQSPYLYNGWLQVGMGGWFTDYSLRCQPVDYTDSPQAIRVSEVSGWEQSLQREHKNHLLEDIK